MEKHLHIISLTVPYPVDYGGVFDLFYKLPALQQQGVHIHLHCFDYGRGYQSELNKYCHSVQYYERNEGHKSVSTSLPYIVSSRRNEQLFANLLQDDYPIFMEGIHCTYLLNDERFAHRRKFVRVHNVEYQYYQDLCHASPSWIKKLFYWHESRMLQQYEHAIATKATAFWGVTHADVEVYRNEFGCSTIDYLPVYLPNHWTFKCLTGKGSYCLYQADLSVDVNEKAAIWLLTHVFNKLKLPLVIAGKNPSTKLQRLAHNYLHTCLVANPNEKEMQDMIAKSHINIIPSFHVTGIKLKLLNALFNGRHCIANEASIKSSGLQSLCHQANTAEETIQCIEKLYHIPFTEADLATRKQLLLSIFNNEANAKQQVQWIWGS